MNKKLKKFILTQFYCLGCRTNLAYTELGEPMTMEIINEALESLISTKEDYKEWVNRRLCKRSRNKDCAVRAGWDSRKQ